MNKIQHMNQSCFCSIFGCKEFEVDLAVRVVKSVEIVRKYELFILNYL